MVNYGNALPERPYLVGEILPAWKTLTRKQQVADSFRWQAIAAEARRRNLYRYIFGLGSRTCVLRRISPRSPKRVPDQQQEIVHLGTAKNQPALDAVLRRLPSSRCYNRSRARLHKSETAGRRKQREYQS